MFLKRRDARERFSLSGVAPDAPDAPEVQGNVSTRVGIASNAAMTLVFQAFTALATIATGVAIARVLGPTGRGFFAYATVSLGVLTTYADGAAAAVMTQYKSDGLPSAIVYRAMMRVLFWVSLVLAGATLLVSVLVPGQRALLAVAFALPFALYAATATSFLVGDGFVQRANAINAVNVIVTMLVVVPLLFVWHVSVYVILIAWVACYIVTGIVTFLWTRQYAAGNTDPHEVMALAKKQFQFALKSTAVYLTAYLNLRIDLFLVAYLRGPIALGLYSLAIGSGELLWKWTQALNWSASGRIAGDSMEQAAALTAKITRLILFVQGVIAIVLFFLGPWLITAVYGPKFAASVPVLRMLLPGIVAYSVELGLGYFVMVKLQRPLMNLWTQGGSTVACAVLTLLLLPRYGLIGAAFATTVTYTSVMLAVAYVFVRATYTRVSDLVVPRWSDVRSSVLRLKRVVLRRT